MVKKGRKEGWQAGRKEEENYRKERSRIQQERLEKRKAREKRKERKGKEKSSPTQLFQHSVKELSGLHLASGTGWGGWLIEGQVLRAEPLMVSAISQTPGHVSKREELLQQV